MSAERVYQQLYELLDAHLPACVDRSSRERIALLVLGILQAEHASPARVAQALQSLGLSTAQGESIERRIRRIENDPELSACTCLHPLARARLRFGRPAALTLIVDPTTQNERVVLLCVAVWYRGRALPLAWSVWPGNVALQGERFWQRLSGLLQVVAALLPPQVPVTWLADRAFGTPQFTDLLRPYGWHFVVRVQGKTQVHTPAGGTQALCQLPKAHRKRAKARAWVFKKAGWRALSVVVYRSPQHRQPLCLVSDLPPAWQLIDTYRARYPIEATFRDYKSFGWQWERLQVRDLAHLERLLVAMAVALWLTLMAGTQVAAELLARPPTGQRHTRPWSAKRSLFRLGLRRLQQACHTARVVWRCELRDWLAPNWSEQLYAHHAYAFVFASVRP